MAPTLLRMSSEEDEEVTDELPPKLRRGPHGGGSQQTSTDHVKTGNVRMSPLGVQRAQASVVRVLLLLSLLRSPVAIANCAETARVAADVGARANEEQESGEA